VLRLVLPILLLDTRLDTVERFENSFEAELSVIKAVGTVAAFVISTVLVVIGLRAKNGKAS